MKKNQSNMAVPQPAVKGYVAKAEHTATFGMLLIAVALAAPFASLQNTDMLSWCKWIYAAGALIFTCSRVVTVGYDRGESLRMRRMRRLGAWGGIAFCIGAFFWFYNETRYVTIAGFGALAILRNTILFSLVGAMLQLVSNAMMGWLLKKESKQKESTQKGSKVDKV